MARIRTATLTVIAPPGKTMQARRTCPTCRQHRPYVIPRSLGECLPCTSLEAAA